MWEDPVVAEVHRARETIAASYNFDIAAFFAELRKRQASLGSRLIPQKSPNTYHGPPVKSAHADFSPLFRIFF